MHNLLDADDLRETADYISDLPDNTNGKELTEYVAKLGREINVTSQMHSGNCTTT